MFLSNACVLKSKSVEGQCELVLLGSQQKVPLLRHPPCQLGLRVTFLHPPPPQYLAQSAETPSGDTLPVLTVQRRAREREGASLVLRKTCCLRGLDEGTGTING